MGTIFKSGIAYLGGGGGNANQEELTWDEYEALTEEEKTNGTVYYITDADEIEPDKFRPVIYSEDEREIGVWTDGKPLYQKTTSVASGNTISMVGLSLKHAQCYAISTSGAIIPVPYNDGSYICWWMSSDAIRFSTQHSEISQYVITYQYTKDSDFAGSGKWTPQGVPAKHYSTDEQIVGTWVDGSTMYEITIHTGALSTGDVYKAHGISNFGELVYTSGNLVWAGKKSTFPLTSRNSINWNITIANVDSTNIVFEVGSNYTGAYAITDSWSTLRYTKQTS